MNSQNQKLGPIELSPGVTQLNALTGLIAAFTGIAVMAGMGILQPYVLLEHLHIPRGQQGTVSGDLAFWTELVAIGLFSVFGVLADRHGRRPVLVFGLSTIAIAYALFPFATSINELLAYRLIYAVGVAATAGTLVTVQNDYPVEESRGKLIGLTSVVNTLGTIFIAVLIARIPLVMQQQGFAAVIGGKAMYLTVALFCGCVAVLVRLGLKGGAVSNSARRGRAFALATAGIRAMKNPRIALAYGSAAAARSDVVIKAVFLALWAVQVGRSSGQRPDQAMAQFGIVIALMYVVNVVSAPLFGWFLDKVNRVTGLIVALVVAVVGYFSMYFIDSPLDMAALPWLVVLTLGTGFMVKSGLCLLGQEAPPSERATVMAASSMIGSTGILVFSAIGGRVFDAWGPWAPFVVIGSFQFLLLVLAFVVRVVAPGGATREPDNAPTLTARINPT